MLHNYSKNSNNAQVAILGILPPPYGGIAVHIERVIALLKKQQNTVLFFNVAPWIRSIRFCFIGFFCYLLYLFCWLWVKRPSQIYFHTLFLSNTLIELRLLLFFKKCIGAHLILVDHNNRFLDQKSDNYKKRLNALLQKVDQQVFMGNTKQYYLQHGLNPVKNHSCESPFLPPDLSRENELLLQYPVELFSFIKQHHPLVIVNASQQTMINGRHLYGFDLCLEIMPRLIERFDNLGFLFVTGYCTDYWRNVAHQNKMDGHCYFLEGSYHLWPLLKKSDLFVRSNRADVYPISIMEALYFNIPVLASSVCQRPPDALVFDIDNTQEFLEKMITILAKKYEAHQEPQYLNQ